MSISKTSTRFIVRLIERLTSRKSNDESRIEIGLLDLDRGRYLRLIQRLISKIALWGDFNPKWLDHHAKKCSKSDLVNQLVKIKCTFVGT